MENFLPVQRYPAAVETFFMGQELDRGPLPTLFYFALHGEQSLLLNPYNTLPSLLQKHPMRIFTFTLPLHSNQEPFQDPMGQWIQLLQNNDPFLHDFLQKSTRVIQELIEKGLVRSEQACLSGLSRGGYIALALLARLPIPYCVAFAPFLDFSDIHKKEHPHFEKWSLFSQIPSLLDKQIQIYIGNLDERVSSQRCYAFITQLAEEAKKQRKRGSFELFLRQSIGHLGHGTPLAAFSQGAQWIEEKLM